MNTKVQYINNTFKYLTQDLGTEEYLTFFALLEKVKDIPILLAYYGGEFIEILIELLPRIEDTSDKALLIETIVQCLYSSDKISETSCKEILDEYILCLRDSATSLDNIVQCLKGFIDAGISKNEIVAKLATNLEKEYVLSILSRMTRMKIDDLANTSDELSKLLAESQEVYNVRARSGIIAQFLLLVHPHIRKYAGISQITFLYDSYTGVYEDCWPRGLLPNMKDTLIKSKVLSPKEVSILEDLDRLINTQGEDLDSMEVRKLYDDFFEGKDPFEVIFTLPE
ncbi:hypothetical protein ABD76_12630 [Paenibacillus dendritiformis]|uniref:hypothetical protein n=1 Tax=Paenibacillus dendritiformis TaxID=130049 RepID=UPI0018CE1695|nr:hypothetical protein [Paenibacillus dendritiformis]MBG9793296.1 hypothetical protein [Paenibacillus dendritiformis]